jgi:hypothetical protein
MPSSTPPGQLLTRATILQTMQRWFRSDTAISRGPISLGGHRADVEVMWIDAMTTEYPFQTLFSVGLSDDLLPVSPTASAFGRVELIMHLPLSWPAGGKRLQMPEYQWPEQWLRTLVGAVADGAIPLPGSHLIISNDEPPAPLGPGTEQTCLLLLADFYQCLPVQFGDGEQVHFYHVVPLATQERDFEKTHGMQPLLEAMASQGLESLVVRPDRPRFVA